MLIGDAAGLAYTQSGEGIRPAIESALIAADVIRQVSDVSARNLERYGEAISERFGTRALNDQFSWQIPDWVKLPLASGLMRSQWFTRKLAQRVALPSLCLMVSHRLWRVIRCPLRRLQRSSKRVVR